MPDPDLERRLRAVERALTGEQPVPDLSDDAELVARVDRLRADVDAVGDRLDTLDAAVQAVRGYVGQIEHVNERVERRANAACAAVDRLESQVADAPDDSTTRGHQPAGQPAGDQLVADQSAADQLVADQSAADQPAADGSVSPEPATDQPTAQQPTAQQPADDSPPNQSTDARTVAANAKRSRDDSPEIASESPTLDPHRPRRHSGNETLPEPDANDGGDDGFLDRLRGLL